MDILHRIGSQATEISALMVSRKQRAAESSIIISHSSEDDAEFARGVIQIVDE